ncbi:MAG TPA: DegT/DnrJ/EryC1/StrS family aminotransferase [Caldilineaceae bacterium]|nr:DegT/DnrJ/EryC1/StrS family aminotransferase [Caldilineaceae bacterium]
MAQLAINGGEKTITRPLGKKWPIFDEREEKALLEVLHSGIWWRGGYRGEQASKVTQLEDAFAAYQDAQYGVAVTNGTTALECALKAAGVGVGDEVLVPALTFVASATAIALVNGIPVFVDVDPKTFNIDPDAMEAAITARTKAAVVVHNGGYPADMDRIHAIAQARGITIIEDAAHAHGSEWRGKRVGALSGLGTFSFQAFKQLTAGEGGMVITNDQELAEKAFSYHNIGRMAGRPFYEFHRLASNLRMTEWQAAILLAQLSRLDEQVETRERNARYLAQGLQEIEGVSPIERDARVTRWSFYYWNFMYDQEGFDGVPRDRFLEAVRAEGVPANIGAHGRPIYRNPIFETMDNIAGVPVDFREVECPTAEHLFANVALSLPHATFLGDQEDMDLILAAIRKVRANVGELL